MGQNHTRLAKAVAGPDGKIDTWELAVIVSMLGYKPEAKLLEEKVKEFIKEVDVSEDGEVSVKELADWLKDNLKSDLEWKHWIDMAKKAREIEDAEGHWKPATNEIVPSSKPCNVCSGDCRFNNGNDVSFKACDVCVSKRCKWWLVNQDFPVVDPNEMLIKNATPFPFENLWKPGKSFLHVSVIEGLGFTEKSNMYVVVKLYEPNAPKIEEKGEAPVSNLEGIIGGEGKLLQMHRTATKIERDSPVWDSAHFCAWGKDADGKSLEGCVLAFEAWDFRFDKANRKVGTAYVEIGKGCARKGKISHAWVPLTSPVLLRNKQHQKARQMELLIKTDQIRRTLGTDSQGKLSEQGFARLQRSLSASKNPLDLKAVDRNSDGGVDAKELCLFFIESGATPDQLDIVLEFLKKEVQAQDENSIAVPDNKQNASVEEAKTDTKTDAKEAETKQQNENEDEVKVLNFDVRKGAPMLRLRIEYHGLLEYFDCFACMESFPNDPSMYLSCSKNHKFCLACAKNYVSYCTTEYAAGRIPVKCQMCNQEYKDREIFYLCHLQSSYAKDLNSASHPVRKHGESTVHPFPYKWGFESDREMWDKYLKASLTAGLLNDDEKDVPVECKRCVRNRRQEAYFELFQKDFQKNSRKFYDEILTRDDMYLMQTYGKEGCDFFDYIRKRNWMIYQRFNRIKEAKSEKDTKSVKDAKDGGVLGVLNRVYSTLTGAEKNTTTAHPEKLDGKFCSVPAKIKLRFEEAQLGLFMHCRIPGCKGHTCLRCLREVSGTDLIDHDCDGKDLSMAMYHRIAGVLDQAAIQICPNCGTRGVKDLACTHITCNKCKKKWCYLCRKLKKDLKGGFSKHNQWKNGRKLKSGQFCPMYLHHLYGGTAQNSLTLFHLHKKELAIEEFKRSLKKEEMTIYSMAVRKFFPNGMFNKRDVEKLKAVKQLKFPRGFKGFENR